MDLAYLICQICVWIKLLRQINTSMRTSIYCYQNIVVKKVGYPKPAKNIWQAGKLNMRTCNDDAKSNNVGPIFFSSLCRGKYTDTSQSFSENKNNAKHGKGTISDENKKGVKLSSKINIYIHIDCVTI